MDFDYDPVKSAANKDKHGLDFEEAQGLWEVGGLTDRLPFDGEDRYRRTARLDGRVWTAIFTLRGGAIRLISVRRARKAEEVEHDRAEREAGDDHQS